MGNRGATGSAYNPSRAAVRCGLPPHEKMGGRGVSCRPFRARRGERAPRVSLRFTLGYIPAAASRLKIIGDSTKLERNALYARESIFGRAFRPRSRRRPARGSARTPDPRAGPASRRCTRTFGCLRIWGNEDPAPILGSGNPLELYCSGRAGFRVGRLAMGTSCIRRNRWSLLP